MHYAVVLFFKGVFFYYFRCNIKNLDLIFLT